MNNKSVPKSVRKNMKKNWKIKKHAQNWYHLVI